MTHNFALQAHSVQRIFVCDELILRGVVGRLRFQHPAFQARFFEMNTNTIMVIVHSRCTPHIKGAGNGTSKAFSPKLTLALVHFPSYRAAFHFPRVKSGNFTGTLPCATDISLSGPGALTAAASYTSISGARPSRMHCIRR